MAKYDLGTKYRQKLYNLALKPKIIKTLEFDQLFNIKNVILYSLSYILASNIKKSQNENPYNHSGQYNYFVGNADLSCK